MNEKITNLITELIAECAKEKVALSLCAFDKKGVALTGQVGSKAKIETAVDQQIEAWVDSLRKCGCPGCKEKLANIDPDDDEREEQGSELNPAAAFEFAQKLEKFFNENMMGGNF